MFICVFFRACGPRLHVCIVFVGFCWSTFSHTGSLYRFYLFLLVQVFPDYLFVSFSTG